MNITKDQVVLFLAPHTDDAEFGAGGTICKLIEQGNEVYQVAFSTAAVLSQDGTKNAVIVGEILKASAILGMKRENLFIHEFNVRRFNEVRQDILELLIFYSKSINPDIIFVTSGNDIHQDHKTIFDEALRAFKTKTIFCYEAVWNNIIFNCNVFISLTEEQVNKKIEACRLYESQAHRIEYRDEFIKALALTRGVQVKKHYAEVFECIRINI